MRLIFMGTPELACCSLQALANCPDFQVTAVVAQPDKPKGRDLKLQPPPVKALAVQLGIPVLQPVKARDEAFVRQLADYQPDLIAVAAYGQILPQAILDLPKHGCLNVHTSLLPKYRGAGPIQWAILNGDAETGVTIMKMDAGLDTGAILDRESTPITAEDDAQTLHDRLARMGADLLVRTIPAYVSGALKPTPQPAEGVSYAPKIKKSDGEIDWNQPAKTVWNRVRGLLPWPGAFSHWIREDGSETMIKLWRSELGTGAGRPGEILEADRGGLLVACGSGAIRILELQREGGKRLRAQDFISGTPLKPGMRLRGIEAAGTKEKAAV